MLSLTDKKKVKVWAIFDEAYVQVTLWVPADYTPRQVADCIGDRAKEAFQAACVDDGRRDWKWADDAPEGPLG